MWIKNIIRLGLAFLFWFSLQSAEAQSEPAIPLSLDDAISRTMSKNQEIKIRDYEWSASLEDVQKMKAIYLPNVSLSATASATNTPLNAFGTKLQQGDITQADFFPDDLNKPSAISNLNTKIEVKQPIINLHLKSMRNAVKAKSEAYRLQSMRTKVVLKNHVVKAYLQLQLMYKVKSVLNQAKATAEANLKLANDNLEAGYLQRADVLSVEVHINDIATQIVQTEHNIQNISDQLSLLMGEEFGEKYSPETEVDFMDGSAILASDFPENRSDIQAMESQVKAYKYLFESTQKEKLPSLNAFGSYELNNNLEFDASQHGFLVGVQASWIIFDGEKNKSDARKASIELKKSETQLEQMLAQNKLEYEIAKRKMLEAELKIELAQKAIQQSKESLRIKTNRFAEGLERTTDILIAETTVSQKQMEYQEAVFQFKMAHADLLRMLEQ